MKKLVLAVALLATFPAAAKSPEDIGRTFADLTACHIAGDITRAQKTIMNLKMIDRYNIVEKGTFWKKRMEAGQLKEFDRLNGIKPLEKALMCGILKDRWL